MAHASRKDTPRLCLVALPVDEWGSFACVPVARSGVRDSLLKRRLDSGVGRGVGARFAVVHTGRSRAPAHVVVHGRSRRSVLLLPAPAGRAKTRVSESKSSTHTLTCVRLLNTV